MNPNVIGDARLAVRAADHHRVAVPRGQVEQQRCSMRAQVAPDDAADVAHDQAEPGVGDVLHGGAVVDVLAPPVAGRTRCRPRISPSVECDVRARLVGDEVEVEPLDAGVGGDRRRRRRPG